MSNTILDTLIANDNSSLYVNYPRTNDQALYNQLWRADSK